MEAQPQFLSVLCFLTVEDKWLATSNACHNDSPTMMDSIPSIHGVK